MQQLDYLNQPSGKKRGGEPSSVLVTSYSGVAREGTPSGRPWLPGGSRYAAAPTRVMAVIGAALPASYSAEHWVPPPRVPCPHSRCRRRQGIGSSGKYLIRQLQHVRCGVQNCRSIDLHESTRVLSQGRRSIVGRRSTVSGAQDRAF